MNLDMRRHVSVCRPSQQPRQIRFRAFCSLSALLRVVYVAGVLAWHGGTRDIVFSQPRPSRECVADQGLKMLTRVPPPDCRQPAIACHGAVD